MTNLEQANWELAKEKSNQPVLIYKRGETVATVDMLYQYAEGEKQVKPITLEEACERIRIAWGKPELPTHLETVQRYGIKYIYS